MESFRPYSLQHLIDGISSTVEVLNNDIKQGYFPKDHAGNALWYRGKSAAVFPFLLNKQRKAVKIWFDEQNEGKKQRYELIKSLYNNIALPYFSYAQYIPGALRIKENVHDVLLMDWVGRQNIKEYIIANIHDVNKLHSLAAKLLELHKDLNKNGIAHGHLTSSNIYIDANNELRLIDYDTIFIKDITPVEKTATSYPEFAHPSQRRVTTLNAQADYFSTFILYLGIKTIAENPMIWGRYNIGNIDGFIFSQDDFAQLTQSQAYADIKKLNSTELGNLLSILELYCQAQSLDQVLPFYEYLINKQALQLKQVDQSNNTDTPAPTPPPATTTTETSKKISVIMPTKPAGEPPASNKKEDKPVEDVPSKTKTESPIPQKQQPTTPKQKGPIKQVPVKEPVVLSDIWIGKNDDADTAIVKVLNATDVTTSNTQVKTEVKSIEKISSTPKAVVVAAEEKQEESSKIEEESSKKVRGKKSMLLMLLTGIVLTSAAAGIYVAKENGLFSNINSNKTVVIPEEEKTEATPNKEEPIISIPISSENDSTSATDSTAIQNDTTKATATIDSGAANAAIIDSTKKNEGAVPASQVNVATESVNKDATTVPSKADSGSNTSSKEIDKKNDRLKRDNKSDDDILNDGTPGKGFNTGIKPQKD